MPTYLDEKRISNLEAAIACYKAALGVFTRDAFPEKWAEIQNDLGNAYSELSYENDCSNLEQAILCHNNALSVYTHDAFPQEYADTKFYLGLAYERNNQLQLAYKNLIDTYEVVELLKYKSQYNLGTKHKNTENWVILFYQKLVEISLHLQKASYDKKYYNCALKYVEASKNPYLQKILADKNMYYNPDFLPIGDFPPKVIDKLIRLRIEICTELQQLNQNSVNALQGESLISSNQRVIQKQNNTINQQLPVSNSINQTSNLYNFSTSLRLNHLYKKLDELIKNKINPIDPTFSTSPTFNYSNVKKLLDEQSVIIEWYITSKSLITFIITQESRYPIVSESSSEELQKLLEWSYEYLNEYQSNKDNWQRNLEDQLHYLSQTLRIDCILEKVSKKYNKLILIPHTILYAFPLHALPLKNGSCVLERFSSGVRYVPSCGVLNQLKNRKGQNFNEFYGIQNPTGDLTYTNMEVEAVSRYFESPNILPNEKATKDSISKNFLTHAHCLHFSCHGYFNFEQPLLSALILADSFISSVPPEDDPTRYLSLRDNTTIDLEKCLTLADILHYDLSRCRLVTLAACETALTDIESISDEYIGLPGAFLVAGSLGVVASLWRINDLSTYVFMIKFYENLNEYSVTTALKETQTWFKDTTTTELMKWASDLKLEAKLTKEISNFLNWFDPDEKPFRHPVYWAAFCVIGQ